MRDGDIYRWSYKNVEVRGGHGPYKAYHCKAQIAVFTGGNLRDTYWHSTSDAYVVDPNDVDLEFKGNINDMTEIQKYDILYYDKADIVSMRHSNNTNGKVYLKAGATRSAKAMMEYASGKKAEAEANIRFEKSQLDRYSEIISQIENGDLDSIYF